MTKMQEYMTLFGSGIKFYDGPGESAHKQFIQIPGQRGESVSLHNKQHFNTTICWFLVMPPKNVYSKQIIESNTEEMTKLWKA